MWHLNRNSHPYAMYDGIVAEPRAFVEVAGRTAAKLKELNLDFRDLSELLVIGAGSSLYAAQYAQYLSWEVRTKQPLRVMSSSDFVEFGPTPSDSTLGICISHRGTERYTSRSVEKLVRLRRPCLYVVGQNANLSHLSGGSFEILETTPQEQSPAHTWSYMGSMAVLCALLQELNPEHSLLSGSLLTDEIPAALDLMLASENVMEALAQECMKATKIWIVGAGADAVIAREVALKIVETSYIIAQGYELEEVIQGPLQGANQDDVFILLNSAGRLSDRVSAILEALDVLDLRLLVLSCGQDGPQAKPFAVTRKRQTSWVAIPNRLPYPYASLEVLIPMQFFAYFLALACGRHPDSFRLDDDRFRLAREKLQG